MNLLIGFIDLLIDTSALYDHEMVLHFHMHQQFVGKPTLLAKTMKERQRIHPRDKKKKKGELKTKT